MSVEAIALKLAAWWVIGQAIVHGVVAILVTLSTLAWLFVKIADKYIKDESTDNDNL